MDLFKESLTLCEIEKILEDLILNRGRDIRIIGDLNLSKEDYRYLSFKVKSLVQHQSNMEMAKKYKYSIIFYLVYSHHYEAEDKIAAKSMTHFFGKLQQYQLRQFINILTEALHESGFDIFGLDNNTFESFVSLILIHAGLIKKYAEEFFYMLNDSTNYLDVKNYEKLFSKKLPNSMIKTYQWIDKENLDKIFSMVRAMFIDCKINHLTKMELCNKYPYISGKLIEMSCNWCEQLESMGSMLKA